jgi:hypothetical protein
MKPSFRIIGLLVVTGVLAGSCHKQDFLDKPPSTELVVPSTLNDFQGLLDNDQIMRFVPALGEISADNYYLSYALWQSAGKRVQNAYTWEVDIFAGEGNVEDWNSPYQQVYYSNVVLDGLANMKPSGADFNNVFGEALFMRAFAFYNIAQVFAPIYEESRATADTGILLRLHQDVSAPSIISSVKQTYNQITGDLRMASGLLPSVVPQAYLNRPSRPAAQALLARVYLSMRKYDSAWRYADSALTTNSQLLDYNTLNAALLIPFPKQNPELLYQASFPDYASNKQVLTGYLYPDCFIDTTLIHSYDARDLRFTNYYNQIGADSFNLKGSYYGGLFPFGGLAVDELYLIRAECRARAGDAGGAMGDINALLVSRWKTGTFTPYTVASPSQALDTVLLERRKELAFRGLRWTDLRRLNKEGANIILSRRLNGTVYTLAPNNILYTLPNPPDVQILSGIKLGRR